MTKAYPNLEGLRFLAAATVVLWHYQHFAFIGTSDTAVATNEQPLAQVLAPIYTFGQYAVQVFWLLSGFIFFAKYAGAIAAGTVSAREFALRRFSRLYPLHLVTMLSVLVLQHVHRMIADSYFVYERNSAIDVALHLVFASQWPPHRSYSLNGPVWSVSLEVLAYATFFLAARYLPRPYWLAIASPALLAWSLTNDSALGQCVALFFLGGVAWVASSALRGVAVIVVTAVALAWLGVLGHGMVQQAQPHAVLSYGGQLLLFTAVALLLVALGALPQATGGLARLLTWLGDLTYSSYLIHFPLQLLAVTLTTAMGTALDWRSPWLLAGYLAATFTAARLVFDRFERPWQERLRTKAGRL